MVRAAQLWPAALVRAHHAWFMIFGQMFVAPAFRETVPAWRPARLLGSTNRGERCEVNNSRNLGCVDSWVSKAELRARLLVRRWVRRQKAACGGLFAFLEIYWLVVQPAAFMLVLQRLQ